MCTSHFYKYWIVPLASTASVHVLSQAEYKDTGVGQCMCSNIAMLKKYSFMSSSNLWLGLRLCLWLGLRLGPDVGRSWGWVLWLVSVAVSWGWVL